MNISDLIFYGGLFLYAMDFLGKSNFIIVGWIILMVLFQRDYKYYLSSESKLLIAFSLIYVVTYAVWYSIEAQIIIRFLIAPAVTYVICDTYCCNSGNAEGGIKALIWGVFVHGLLNMILTLSSGYQKGYIKDIWGGVLTTTLQGMLLTPIASLLFYGVKRLKKYKFEGFAYIAASVSCFIFSIITGRRTLVIVFLGILTLNILISVYKAHRIDFFLKVMGGCIIFLVILFMLYNRDFFKMKTFFLHSNFYNRVFLADKIELGASRTSIHIYVLLHIIDYIFGGNIDIGIANYAHNLWLDVMIMCGVIPMIILIAYTLKTAKTAYSLYFDNDLKLLYCSVFFAVNAVFFVEPVLSGAPHMFIIMCMMNGMIYGEIVKNV